MGTVISRYIDIPGMNNTRDLGGMRTMDGRTVRPHLLYRSAKLAKLEDPGWFTRHVGLLVDLRTSMEAEESPDPEIPGVEHLHLPIFEMQATGVTRDRESDRGMEAPDPESAAKRMAAVYARFVSDEFCLSQYRRFLRLLLTPAGTPIAWHCTGGKDRTGVAAMLVQELLGVSREDVMADYLSTNTYLKEEVRHFIDAATARADDKDRAGKAVLAFMEAREEYLLTVYTEAEARYGSFGAFLREGLGVSDAEREELRRRYLE